jgi:hypothetical protein
MKRKKVKIHPDIPSEPIPTNASEPIEQQTEAFVTRNVDEPEGRAERISIKLKEDGAVDWDSMRGETREKVVSAFANDPEALRLIGLKSTILPTGQGITEENAKAALQALASVDRMLVPLVLRVTLKVKIEPQVAAQCFAFNEDQLKEMSPRAARLANKYSSAAILKYQDEIALLGMFGLYLSEQVKSAIVMQTMINMQRKHETVQTMPEGFTPANGKAASESAPLI